MIKRLALMAWIVVMGGAASAQNFIPQVAKMNPLPGVFAILPTTPVVADEEVAFPAEYLDKHLRILDQRGALPPSTKSITLAIDPTLPLPAEGYRIRVDTSGITLTGKDYNGVFYAVQTLLQMMPADIYANNPSGTWPGVVIPACEIEDYPAFGHRSTQLDCARTFQSVERVKEYIDNMSRHKLNHLHWHLTDDEGWRIEVKAYPQLTDIAAWRGGDSPVMSIYGRWNEKYGGYYTQDEIREIVAFAAERGISITPEIDLPGHSRATGKALPQILCRTPIDTTASQGYDRRSAWCPAKEDNYKIIETIIKEVAALFPSEYFHVGGDEVIFSQWRGCPDCAKRMKTLKLTRHEAYQAMFMERVAKAVTACGKTPVMWDEAIDGGKLDKKTLISGWRSVAKAREAARKGYQTVVMPSSYFYIDMRQSPHEPGLTWAGPVSAERLYSFSLAKTGFTEDEIKNVKGFEAPLWSEALAAQSPDFLYYQAYPRLCAHAELCWRGEDRGDWNNFYGRLAGNVPDVDNHLDRLTAMGIPYREFPPYTAKYRQILDPLSSVTVELPVDEYADSEGTWWIRFASVDDGVMIDRLSLEANEKTYTLTRGGKLNPLNAIRLRVDSLNRDGTLTLKLRNTGNYPADVRVEFELSPYLEPATGISTTFTAAKRTPISNAVDYNHLTPVFTTRSCRPGDHVTYTFAEPVDAASIEVGTGYYFLVRHVIPFGYVETSADGHTFARAGQLSDGSCTVYPDAPVKALRIVSESKGNGESFVILRDLKILPRTK